MEKTVRILWKNAPEKGRIDVVYGKPPSVFVSGGEGRASGDCFGFNGGEGAVDVTVPEALISPGAFATILRVRTERNSFSFFMRDALSRDCPVWIPEYGAAAVPGGDSRPYGQVEEEIRARKILSDFDRFETNPEESFEAAAARNRNQYCPVWLGLSRDMRIFRFGYVDKHKYFGEIVPCFHSHVLGKILFAAGQGASCRPEITRRLRRGCLPILEALQKESFMNYGLTAFASLETAPPGKRPLKGSHWLAAYAHSNGNMLGEEEKKSIEGLLEEETLRREEEVILCCRIEALNTGRTPCYAWFKAPYADGTEFAPESGFTFSGGKVLAVTALNGKPVPQEETAVLVQPGEKIVWETVVPHSPISEARAARLAELDFDSHLDGAEKFWLDKLDTAAVFSIPEKKIDEAVKAGLLHCDIAALGREPDGPVAATIGWYSPIGTESSPIIQYFDSVGWHRLAERSIEFFLKRQRKDGFIQNFSRYESETGPLLWTIGEHFRHTEDEKWLKRIMPGIRKAVDYILKWREKNKKEEYKEKGFYGLVDGKVADPEDYYHSFFLNAGCYIGIKRIAEITGELFPDYADGLKKEAEEFRLDIRRSFYRSQANAPVVPAGDGSWAPLMPPWTEYNGGITLYADGGNWFSHGAFASRSCLTGPLWLVICEVLSPEEEATEFMLKSNRFPVTLENACLSQPYYSRHDFAHIKRGEVKSFLKCFYNQLTALADRETYTFWEHYYEASQHKTHEEAWFLMQTRWMLYLENGREIQLFSAAPRKWFGDGKKIEVKNASSYFGRLSFGSCSEIAGKKMISAYFECAGKNAPGKVKFRIPHPDGARPVRVEGAGYDPACETAEAFPGNGRCSVRLFY